jgi:hypothetical protein
MVTVDKKHVSSLLLVEAYAEKHKTEEKVALFHKKYNWDNAPHHKHLKTFPNHMLKNDLIEESDIISIKEVLKYITSCM